MRARELTYRSKRTKEGVKLDVVKADGCLIALREMLGAKIRMCRASGMRDYAAGGTSPNLD
jgi:hypothetical protein